MKSLFITGATGFIGQRLVNALDGEIRVLSREKQSNYDTIVCNLQYEMIPDDALDGVDTVFHLAGFAHDLRDASETQKLYQKVNVVATARLAELAVKSNVKRFVFVSSVKAGGIPSFGVCGDEKDQKKPDGIYGETKREAELILLDATDKSEMHVSIIRPSLVYGPNVKGNLELMISGIKKGWFPPLPEIGNRRSMIHVDDLVQAILLIAEDDRANREIFIATDGAPYSTNEIYDMICVAMNKPVPKWSLPKFFFDKASLIHPSIKYRIDKIFNDECYSSKKLEHLGFKAKRSLNDINIF